MAVGRSQAAVLIAPRPNAKFIIAASSAMGISYLQGAETDSAVSQPLANHDARVVSQAAVCSAPSKIVDLRYFGPLEIGLSGYVPRLTTSWIEWIEGL